MAWTTQKSAECMQGKHHKKEQKKKPQKASSTTIAAAAVIAVQPHFAALMATLANLKE
jgi:hypothetical protein